MSMGCISRSGCAVIFTVTDAGRLLADARAAYVQVNPGATADEAKAVVTSAADAIFIILESSRLLGSAADRVLAAHAGDGWSRPAGGRR